MTLRARSSSPNPVVTNRCRRVKWQTRKAAKYPIHWLCDDGKPYPGPISSGRIKVSYVGVRGLCKAEPCRCAASGASSARDASKNTLAILWCSALTVWSFLLDDVLEYPIGCLAQQLACPHFDEQNFTRIHGESCVRRLSSRKLISFFCKVCGVHPLTLSSTGVRVSRASTCDVCEDSSSIGM